MPAKVMGGKKERGDEAKELSLRDQKREEDEKKSFISSKQYIMEERVARRSCHN